MCETGNDWRCRGARWAATASAQATSGQAPLSVTQPSRQATQTTGGADAAPAATRPATTTPMGDTGLWFVHRRGASSQAVVGQCVPGELRLPPGLHGRVELAGDIRRSASRTASKSSARGRWYAASTATSRPISSQRRPAASSTTIPSSAGVVRQSARRHLWLGGKVNLLSQYTTRSPWRSPYAACSRCRPRKTTKRVLAPARLDFPFDGIVSKEINKSVELAGYGGIMFRGDPMRSICRTVSAGASAPASRLEGPARHRGTPR